MQLQNTRTAISSIEKIKDKPTHSVQADNIGETRQVGDTANGI